MKENSLPNETDMLLRLQRNDEQALALAQNPDNYRAAVASMGGDGLTQRIFWDKP
jgi:hypothetical protein